MLVRRAAELYNVPKSTLSDWVSGRAEFGSHSGPSRYVTDEEEGLVNFICGCASMGYAKTKKDILTVVEEIVASKGYRQVNVSNGWWKAFKQRHLYLTLRTVEKLSYACAVASDPVVIDRYYDLLEETLRMAFLTARHKFSTVTRQAYLWITLHHLWWNCSINGKE